MQCSLDRRGTVVLQTGLYRVTQSVHLSGGTTLIGNGATITVDSPDIDQLLLISGENNGLQNLTLKSAQPMPGISSVQWLPTKSWRS